MSLTTGLFTGLSGLDAHGKKIDVIGNNITNVNTVGFKSSRAIFESQLYRNLGTGTGPRADNGGTNPTQLGLGVKFAGTHRDHSNGSIQPTGVNTDLALEGDGFFVLQQNDQSFYTRDGQFDLAANGKLTDASGSGVVQGFGVDENFNIVPGVMKDLSIPLGSLTVTQATRNVNFAGNLNAAGEIADAGTIITSQPLSELSSGNVASGGTSLADLTADGTAPLFAEGDASNAGDVITIQGVEKGGKSLGTLTFEVNSTNTTGSDASGTTFGELTAFLEDALGVDPSVDGAGVTVDTNGALRVEGNVGTINDINLQTADLFTNGVTPQPFFFQNPQDAAGESVRTSFAVYDSLGTPLTVDLNMVLTEKDSNGTTWRFYAESPDDTDVDLSLDTGELRFNSFGELLDPTSYNLQIDRTGTGAVDPLTTTLNFASEGNEMTALTDNNSELAAIFQDGSPIGTLDSFSIGEDGVINGAFTNGLTRPLGQVALATFTNPQGLVEEGSNLYSTGPNSGVPVEVPPLSFGTGRLVSGALELSNVDLSKEFVKLITTSTGFSASSRVITTSDELLQQLLATAR